MKNCSRCKLEKSEEEYYPIKGKRNKGLQSWCKECQNEDSKTKWQALTYEERRAHSLKRLHGISIEDYEFLDK